MAAHGNIAALCLSIFLVRAPPLSHFFALYLLFLSLLLSLILDILTAWNHLFKFCVIFYVNKNIKYVDK